MGLFDKLFKKEEAVPASNDIFAACTGEYVSNDKISDPMFAENMMGKTIGIEPTDGDIVSPCDGEIEAFFPTGHAFGLRMADGTGVLVHIGIDTVNLGGAGFTALKKTGDKVKAGESVVKVDLESVKAAGCPITTMIIITEPVDGRNYDYVDYGPVTKGQKISL